MPVGLGAYLVRTRERSGPYTAVMSAFVVSDVSAAYDTVNEKLFALRLMSSLERVLGLQNMLFMALKIITI